MNIKIRTKKLIMISIFVFLSFANFAQSGGAIYESGPLMKRAKIYPISTLLSTGKIVSFGGREFNFISGSNSEIYDPITNTFSETTMNFPHDGSSVVKMRDGCFFIIGGSKNLGVAPGYATTEMYNPSTNSFDVKASMTMARMQMGAAQLNNGKVLIVGAWYNPNGALTSEIYDSSTNSFTKSGSLNQPRAYPIVIPTNDGGAVVAGGWPTYGGATYTNVEYYETSSGSFTTLSSQLITTDSGWVLSPVYTRPITDCRMSNGNYLMLASRYNPSLEYSFIIFNPTTKSFSKLNTNLPLADSLTDGGIFDFVLNKTNNMAYFLGADSGIVPLKLALVSVDLGSGHVYHPRNSFSLPNDEYLFPTMIYMPYNDKILVQGVSTTNLSYFFGTDKTYLLTPQFSVEIKNLTETKSRISLYPNPASDNLNIEFNGDVLSKLHVKLYDLVGKEVINDLVDIDKLSTGMIRYNTSQLSEGFYKLIVLTNKDILVKTIIINRP